LSLRCAAARLPTGIFARLEQAAALADETRAPPDAVEPFIAAAGLVSVFLVNRKGRDSDTEPAPDTVALSARTPVDGCSPTTTISGEMSGLGYRFSQLFPPIPHMYATCIVSGYLAPGIHDSKSAVATAWLIKRGRSSYGKCWIDPGDGRHAC
jgi:hypothetical protein